MNLDDTRLLGDLMPHGGQYRPRHELLALAWIAGQRSERTRYSYAGCIRRWFAWLESHDADPLVVERYHVELFVRGLEKLNRKPATIGIYLTVLSSYYQYCVEEAGLEKNPVDKIKRPTSRERISSDRKWLTRPQVFDLLEGARDLGPTQHGFLCVLALNGLRVAEACSLDVESMETFGDYMGVRFVRKGGQQGQAIFARRTEIAVEQAIDGRRSGPIFLHSYGGRMNQKAAQRIIDKAMLNVRGNKPRITPHSLRHSWATMAAQAGVPLDQLRHDGGWVDMRTPGVYMHGRHNPAAASTHAVSALVAGAA